jgi:DNA-directed RNA polymerase specialized sigma24 family protein
MADLYDLLYPRVMTTNYRRLGGLRVQAEDATQDVFFRLVKYADFSQVRTPEQFLGYLKTVCENVCAERFRELTKQTVGLEEGLTEELEEKLSPAIQSSWRFPRISGENLRRSCRLRSFCCCSFSPNVISIKRSLKPNGMELYADGGKGLSPPCKGS